MPGSLSDRQAFASFGPAPGQHRLTAFATATHQKTVGARAFEIARLISALAHFNYPKNYSRRQAADLITRRRKAGLAALKKQL